MERLIYGVIPARAGSKGIPGKNRRMIAGKPLIAHTCEAALRAKLSKVILNTDDEEIISYVSTHYPQIIIPFKRPSELAQDNSEAIAVARHLLDWIATSVLPTPHALCWLQPTSPLRNARHINDCLELLADNDCVLSTVDVGGMTPYKMKQVDERGLLKPLFPKTDSTNRQSFPATFIGNGAITLSAVRTLLEQGNFHGEVCASYIMDRESSINIDDELDFIMAEYFLNKQKA